MPSPQFNINLMPPTSPSHNQYNQPLPLSPSKSSPATSGSPPTSPPPNYNQGLTIEAVRVWTEDQVGEWLRENSLGQFEKLFSDNNINGDILIEIDNEALKEMLIATVGERVRVLAAVRALRRECFQSAQNLPPIKITPYYDPSRPFEFMRPPPPVPKIAAYTSPETKLPKPAEKMTRSNSIQRLLQRNDSKKGAKSEQPQPNSPKGSIFDRRNSKSNESTIMTMEKVKQLCIRVIGEEGQSRVVNVQDAKDAKSIMSKVFHKFGIDDPEYTKYSMFIGSSESGAARMLTDAELVDICKSADRPEKEKLILRKKHVFISHQDFRKQNSSNPKYYRPFAQPPPTPESKEFKIETSLSTPSSGSISKRRGKDVSEQHSEKSTWFGRSEKKRGGEPPDSVKASFADLITWREPVQSPKGSKSQGTPLSPLSQRVSIPREVMPSSPTFNPALPAVTPVTAPTAPTASTAPPKGGLFGDRPTSEVISNNIPEFFPGHKPETIEAEITNAQIQMAKRISNRKSVRSNMRISIFRETMENVPEDEEYEKEEIPPLPPLPQPQESDKISANDKSESNNKSESDENTTNYQKPHSKDEEKEKEKEKETPAQHVVVEEEVLDVEVEEEVTDEEEDDPVEWIQGRLIGRGTFGEVYLGLNQLTGVLMAVKQVELPVANSATEERKTSMINALHREIALLQDLHHDNIVQYLGSKSDEKNYYIFLEYVPGGSVWSMLANYGPFQEKLVRTYVKQILRGLNYLHEKDIIHRDIKGANILVDTVGVVKISDFGISKKVEDDILASGSSSSHRPSLQGSVFWMAPEVVKQEPYTYKADIWSLGCLVIEMLTGEHPFPQFSQMQVMFKIGNDIAPTPPDSLSSDARDFLSKTFEIKQQLRSSAKELLDHPFLTSKHIPTSASTTRLLPEREN